jgi:hypothetical protein
MSSYDLTRAADRARMRADRMAEIEAVDAGAWPRNPEDEMRWLGAPTSSYLSATHNQEIRVAHAKKVCLLDIAYLDEVERRIQEGDSSLAGWE